jgi:hypothetical protein
MEGRILYLKLKQLLGINLYIFVLSAPVLATEKQQIDMGYWLDQAASYCHKQEQKKLNKTLYNISKLVKKSAITDNEKRYVYYLLESFQQGQCSPLDSSIKSQYHKKNTSKWYDLWQKINQAKDNKTQLKAGLSYADNINSGSRHRLININDFFGGTDGSVSLFLDQANLPQSDIFNEFSLKHQRSVNSDWSMYAAYYHQKYKRYKQYNLTVLELGLKEKSSRKNIDNSLYDISIKTTLLNQSHWQNAFTFSSIKPLTATENYALYWENNLNYSHYTQQKDYNAIDLYSGLKYLYKTSGKSSVQIKTAIQHDHALKGRPGKHRNTLSSSISTKYRLAKQWDIKTVLQVKQRVDSEAYNKTLFSDKKRQQTLTHASVSLRKAIGHKKSLILDYAVSRTKDKNIPLFDTEKNQYIGIGMEFNW